MYVPCSVLQELFNTSIWGPESYYDELAKLQKVEMDKREKEKKDRTKVVIAISELCYVNQ